MKKNMILGLTASVMMLSMISVIAIPAFAHPANVGQFAIMFDPSTKPQKGTEYVLTISGKADLASLAGGFTKHAPNKAKAVGSTNPQEVLFNTKAGSRVISGKAVDEVPVSGQITIKVADFYVATPQSSNNAQPKSLLVNPNAVVFIVESGNVKVGDKTYAVDSGVAIHYKELLLTIRGNDLALDVRGTLFGGIPGTQITAEQSGLANISQLRPPMEEPVSIISSTSAHMMLNVGGEHRVIEGSIVMSESA